MLSLYWHRYHNARREEPYHLVVLYDVEGHKLWQMRINGSELPNEVVYTATSDCTVAGLVMYESQTNQRFMFPFDNPRSLQTGDRLNVKVKP